MIPAKISEYFGESIVVDCAATGKPTPVLTWYKDGVELSSSNGLAITNTTNGSYAQRTLTISSLIDADEGIYKCIATNELPNGTVTQSSLFELDVIGCKSVNVAFIIIMWSGSMHDYPCMYVPKRKSSNILCCNNV